MYLTHIELTNFRNYRHLEASFSPGVTLLWGSNAAGKSGFLEALHMLATTRSHRAGAERQLVHWEASIELGMPPFARVVGHVERRDGPQTLEMTVQRKFDAEGNLSSRCLKRFLVNRRAVRTREAAGRLQVVLFEPEDLYLITGSPSRRRRYLDSTLMQADARYWQSLQRYQRVVTQRNQLLRQWRAEGVPQAAREQMAFWNRELVQHGAYIIVSRHRLIASLAPSLAQLHGRLSGVSETLVLTYLHRVPCSPGEDQASVAYAFRQALADRWSQEIERGTTVMGPHRDDIGFFLDDIDVAVYGSRGQQRTATIALKLAQVEWLQQQSGEEPVILLDDVLSELDPQRQGYLQEWLLEGGHQVFVTATDLHAFRSTVLEQADVYHIEAGRWSRHKQRPPTSTPDTETAPATGTPPAGKADG